MNIRMLKFIKDNFLWIKDVALVVFMAAVLYLNSHFVTKEEFKNAQDANKTEHTEIKNTLVQIDKTLALMQQNQSQLANHEKDISELKVTVTSLDKSNARLEDRVKRIEDSHPPIKTQQ